MGDPEHFACFACRSALCAASPARGSRNTHPGFSASRELCGPRRRVAASSRRLGWLRRHASNLQAGLSPDDLPPPSSLARRSTREGVRERDERPRCRSSGPKVPDRERPEHAVADYEAAALGT